MTLSRVICQSQSTRLIHVASAQAAIADLDLLEKVQRVNRLDERDRALVKDVMDLVVLKGRVRQLAGTKTTTVQEALAEVQAQAS